MNYSALFDCKHSRAGEYIGSFAYPWQALVGLKDYLISVMGTLEDGFIQLEKGIWVHESACIAPSARFAAPCIIGKNTEIRQGAFIRGGVLIGDGCVIGNSVELKNCIVFDGAQIPHFNYVGDSIIGYRAHLGAGAITSNVRLDKKIIAVKGEEKIDTGMRKFGAVVGDFAEVGCNAVLNPGTVLGRRAVVYPLTSVRGVVEEGAVLKK